MIGCNFYFAGSVEKTDDNAILFSHLRGVVRDVNDAESFLVDIGVSKDNIVKLTASHDPHSPSRPMEDSTSKWSKLYTCIFTGAALFSPGKSSNLSS